MREESSFPKCVLQVPTVLSISQMNFLLNVFGVVNEETPDYRVICKKDEYEVWRYPSQVSAAVYARDLFPSKDFPVDDDKFAGEAFRTLARYIGVFSTPENDGNTSGLNPSPPADSENGNNDSSKSGDSREPEKISMTAPVVMTKSSPETISMTAPVVMKTSDPDGGEEEESSETAKKGSEQSMRFFLPSKYKSIEDAPAPSNPVVKLELVEEGRYEAVLQFSGASGMKRAPKYAKELLGHLKNDDVIITGDWSFHGYNPPFSLPWVRRNEIHVPVDPASFKDVPADGSTDNAS